MALMTYLIAFAHFSSEIFIFRTAKIGPPVLSPCIVASELICAVCAYEAELTHNVFASNIARVDDLAV